MTVIVIDGPEKAGKTTLVAALSERCAALDIPCRMRKWGKLDDGRWAVDQVYATALAADHRESGLVIWDRSWASEAVYGQLLGRDRRLAADPWLGEWLYGRAVPLRFILAGPNPSVMDDVRTLDDLPVLPAAEQAAFVTYGRTYGWRIIPTPRDGARIDLTHTVDAIMAQLPDVVGWNPETYCGRPNARVVFVGDARLRVKTQPGGWLLFTTEHESRLGRSLGTRAFECGWADALADPVDQVLQARVVVPCGSAAEGWVKEVLADRAEYQSIDVVRVPHPGALYRWSEFVAEAAKTESKLHALMNVFIGPDRATPTVVPTPA